ncbi:Protein TIME FOR COFFEE [Platanthera zijinensis]|uniref:Protein TIME FOR COFFEE n=1 Tax=Platanthera zijinensis TaxID=2320716 RepID=A0AAP0G192_9ASPA
MDRIREARRGSMAAVNGGLARRRQRSSGLRDSPDEDGAMEMQETVRLRDRGSKKDRDRDRSGRNKRRRGDRMLHGSHREEGDDSSEESLDEDDDDEEDDSTVAGRLPTPSAPNPAPTAPVMQNHHLRKGFPVKSARAPGTGTWKVVEEMIGASIPRKARSSSVKRSQECWLSGGGAGGGGDQIHRPASMSPARPSPTSTTPVSPSSSNVSVRKKVKLISGSKQRLSKTSKTSSIQEIEIEVAEVLFGMTRQVPLKPEDQKHDPKESNGSGLEVKSRVSSPYPISSPIATSPAAARPSNPSSNAAPLTAMAPKRKLPRKRFEDESPTSPPNAHVLPATSNSSAAKLETEAAAPPPAAIKTDTSPRSEKKSIVHSSVSSDPVISITSSAAKVQQETDKTENIMAPDRKDSECRPEKRAKEEAICPPKESTCANLDVKVEEDLASKAAVISENQREDKFSFDLMALPGRSSPEMENSSDNVAEFKSVEMELAPAPKPELSKGEELEKTEKKSKTEPEEILLANNNGGKQSTDDSDLKKQAGKERNLDLLLDLEKIDKDVNGSTKNQSLKQQSRAPRVEQKIEKSGLPASSSPMAMQIPGWPGGFPPFGYMGPVPPLPPVVPVDGSSTCSKTVQVSLSSPLPFFFPPCPTLVTKLIAGAISALQSFLPSQLRPKRCAAHCYIAQNIHYHQQITRLNPFWPSAPGAAPMYAAKQYNLNTAPPSDAAIIAGALPGSLPGRSLGSVQEKPGQVSAAYSGLSSKDKNSAASTQFIDAASTRKVPAALQQSAQPGSAGNMLAPAFIFPMHQQQAQAVTQAATVGAANRSGAAKLSPGSGNVAPPSTMAASGANGPGMTMNFNYPGLPPNEQYLAFLQNNAYSFPIPAHVSGAPSYRAANPGQTLPYFNLSFYSPSMIHPTQLRLQQPPPGTQQQPPYSQQGHQNPSTSSGSSSSQKNTQQSQRVPTAAASAVTAGNSHGFPSSKQQLLHQVRQIEPEPVGEDAPSTADSRVSQAQKSMYTQKFSIPAHSQNFALIAPAAAALSGGGGHGEKQQQAQNQVMKMDLTPSQAFAMSFASFGGAAAASTGAAPHGFDFSSISQNHALFQSLPEPARQGYQVSAAAHSAQQRHNNSKKAEDGKPAPDLGNTNAPAEEAKNSPANKPMSNSQQQSLTFTRADTEPPMSSIINNSMIDGSSRTLNLIQQPPNGAQRVSNRPASASPASNSMTASSHGSSSPHVLSQQHQQQVLQLQKQHQQLQMQQQLQQQQQRAKPAASHNSANVYSDRLPGNSAAASKYAQGLAGFPPALTQSSAAAQPAQWKAAARVTNPPSAATTAVAVPPPSSSSTKNQMPLQQQVRGQQPSAAHQPHQISFGVSPAKVAGQLGPASTAGSPQNSVSKSSGGSPHSSSAIPKSAPPPSPVLPVMPFQKLQSGKNSSSSSNSPLPAVNRNMPSILGNPHNTPPTTPQHMGSKPLPSAQHLQQSQMSKQHFPQAQFFFSNPYMQTQNSQSDMVAAAAAGYFQQHHRRQSDQQQSQARQNSLPATTTGMLSLGPSSSLSLTAGGGPAPDPSKGSAGAVQPMNNSKNLTPAGLMQQHQSQFAAVSQPGSGTTAAAAGHPMMPYIHAMQSVPLKPDVSASGEQKPAAEKTLSTLVVATGKSSVNFTSKYNNGNDYENPWCCGLTRGPGRTG